ncbi:hypothetical protein L596_030294 [Steinernema carpocapsae]|uniref:CXXC-type domain-containing protein n=1 Tax=Steinernema carpocapsae TaxID=34508 RepID=A0A4V5ZWW5_STECR|nr:hypothetical protein L596_030294 [Steinernema carpocapsae]
MLYKYIKTEILLQQTQAQQQAPPQAQRYATAPPPTQAGHRNTASSSTPSSMNRSQRCGVCRGCQCKPCGQCTYCQDSPQFGGPGVKKQSCIERRCLRVLENRLQRDAPTFKARQGCNNCEDCRMADCMTCLVCLDRKFFDNRYMTGAMCAKKRCNHATSIELPAAQNAAAAAAANSDFNSGRQMLKRSYDSNGNGTPNNYDYMSKRRAGETVVPQGIPQAQVPPHMLIPGQPTRMISLPVNSNGNGMNPIYTAAMPHPAMRMLPHPPQPNYSLLVPMTSIADISANNPVTSQPQSQQQQGQQQQQHPPTSQSQQQQQQQSQQQNQNEQPQQTQLPPQQVQQQPPPVPQTMLMNGNYMLNGYPPMATHLTDMCVMDPRLMQPNPQKLYPYYSTEGVGNDLGNCPPQDPFVPPSYAPETKSTVLLTPL